MIGLTKVHGLLILSLCGAIATALMLLREHLTLDVSGRGATLLFLGLLLCAAIRSRFAAAREGAGRIARDLADYVGLFASIAVIGAVASYPVAAASYGMVDPALQRVDRLLHFDWTVLYALVAKWRSLQIIGVLAYQSIYLSPAVLLGYFAWSNRGAEACQFILSFWLAVAITLLLFRWFPAAGPLATLWKGPIIYLPQSELFQAHLIPALQQHRLRIVDVDALRGLVSAPSFHTASGVLYINFARNILRLRTPLIIMNLLMIAATPIEGTHYLVDVVGGALVALIALAIATVSQTRSLRVEVSSLALAGRAAASSEC